ncbi:unnamed protein product, partial [Rotaria socialis]
MYHIGDDDGDEKDVAIVVDYEDDEDDGMTYDVVAAYRHCLYCSYALCLVKSPLLFVRSETYDTSYVTKLQPTTSMI